MWPASEAPSTTGPGLPDLRWPAALVAAAQRGSSSLSRTQGEPSSHLGCAAPHSSWLRRGQPVRHSSSDDADQLAVARQQAAQPLRSPASGNSARRRVPAASGDRFGAAARSSRAARRDSRSVALRAVGGGGLGAGAGGLFCGPSEAFHLRLWPLGGSSRAGAAGKQQKTILIMMSNTGGGHKASAEALKQACEEQYGSKYKVLIVDMWKEHTPAPFNQLPDSYSFLVRHSFLWWATYHSIQPRAIHYPYFSALRLVVARRLREAFDSFDPDLVVSVHPLMNHIPAAVLAARARDARAARPTPLATVVTDFTTCHNTWFCPRADACFVPTDFCRRLGLAMGLSEQQLVQYGLPIRPVFSKRLPAKAALRKKLGLLRDVPAILLVGGGEGMGKLQATVKQLDAQLQGAAQVAVICGRNATLLAKLRGAAWPGGSHVVAVGFVDNIHEWMAAADAIITKAGPGTIAEALISGLPILLNGNIPCQEEGNVSYVVDNGVGEFETDPARIASIMARWLDPANKAQLRRMAARSKALGRPQAVYDIARGLAELADTAGAEARQLLRAGSGGKRRLAAAPLAA